MARSASPEASLRPSCSSTSAITTFAPSAAKPCAKLAPIPRAPPVTITVRLWKRFMVLSFNLVAGTVRTTRNGRLRLRDL